MTPLEKAKAAGGRVNYCDECESFVILNDAPYCKVDGKLIHPIMLVRGQGPAPRGDHHFPTGRGIRTMEKGDNQCLTISNARRQ